MFKKLIILSLVSSIAIMSSCNNKAESVTAESFVINNAVLDNSTDTLISMSENEITVNGEMISGDASENVYIANDIIYYESGKDASYGEGTEADTHSAEDAAKHTVVHITKPGTYRLSGSLNGQIFVDLGDNAKEDINAIATLILDNVDITCTVAPAILFYNVYECGVKDETTATATVNTSNAGANVIIADHSINTINGAYVARIYEPGTTDKLHKYDGAFYSKRSMNIDDAGDGTGVLHINATNEGLDSEMHLTINGGNITITSQNDGINTNEDNISVTTINDGVLTINAGLGAEGDGIDSNGFITINGGTILTSSCDKGPDGGIDADRDIIINGGTIIACGNQNGEVSKLSTQKFLQATLPDGIPANSNVTISSKLLNDNNNQISFTTIKSCTALTISSPKLDEGEYKISINGNETVYNEAGRMQPPMFNNGKRPEMGGERFEIPNAPEGIDEWMNETEIPEDIRTWINKMKDFSKIPNSRDKDMMQPPDKMPNV